MISYIDSSSKIDFSGHSTICTIYNDNLVIIIPAFFILSIIPSIDHAMIEEKENIEEETWNFVRKNVAEIVICDESLDNLKDSSAKLGKLHIFTLNRTSGEEECLDDEGSDIKYPIRVSKLLYEAVFTNFYNEKHLRIILNLLTHFQRIVT